MINLFNFSMWKSSFFHYTVFNLKIEDEDWWWWCYSLSLVLTVCVLIGIFSHVIATIVRMPNPLWRSTKNSAVEVHKKPIQLPYIFKLKDATNQITNCVTFHLKTNRKAEIKLFWGVSVLHLFEMMRCPWSHFRTTIKEDHSDICHSIIDCPFEQLSLQRLHVNKSSDGAFDDVISVHPPSHLNWADLKNKYRYPLAIVIYNPDVKIEDTTVQDGGNEIHGLFVILHVKSEIFRMPTAILSSYIKMDNGNTFLLKPLYLVEDADGVTETTQETEEHDSVPHVPEESLMSNPEGTVDPFPNVVCCVCQTLPVSRAILPCGHVSLCSQCFQKVDKCPICRGVMQFYFRTRNEDYVRSENGTAPAPQRHQSWWEILDDWNENINNWLGLQA